MREDERSTGEGEVPQEIPAVAGEPHQTAPHKIQIHTDALRITRRTVDEVDWADFFVT